MYYLTEICIYLSLQWKTFKSVSTSHFVIFTWEWQHKILGKSSNICQGGSWVILTEQHLNLSRGQICLFYGMLTNIFVKGPSVTIIKETKSYLEKWLSLYDFCSAKGIFWKNFKNEISNLKFLFEGLFFVNIYHRKGI